MVHSPTATTATFDQNKIESVESVRLAQRVTRSRVPDDSAAEIVVHLKKIGLHMVNWCVWHYRFGQNTTGRFINSKVHALYFCKDPNKRTWNPDPILEVSDRRAIYGDPRTESKKDGMPAGMRVKRTRDAG